MALKITNKNFRVFFSLENLFYFILSGHLSVLHIHEVVCSRILLHPFIIGPFVSVEERITVLFFYNFHRVCENEMQA